MVKSVTVPGKCYAISDGDRQDDPIFKPLKHRIYEFILYEFIHSTTKEIKIQTEA